MRVEVLAVGPHPDDVEVGLGGLMAKLAAEGHATGILDLTRGELGTRGTPQQRHEEASSSAKILGASIRTCADLPDGGVCNGAEQRRAVIRQLRELRPRVLLAPLDQDRHPDHDAAFALVRDAAYLAGLTRIDTGQEPHRPEHLYFYRVYGDPTPPDMLIDISSSFDTKVAALKAFASQFHNPAFEGPETYVASEAFWRGIETRAAYWGGRIGVRYAEGLHATGPIAVATVPGLERTS